MSNVCSSTVILILMFIVETIDICSKAGVIKKLLKRGGENAAQLFTLCETCLVVYADTSGLAFL